MEKENWLPVLNYELNYEISNYGNVRSNITKKHLKKTKCNKGYYRVSLSKNSIKKNNKNTFVSSSVFSKS